MRLHYFSLILLFIFSSSARAESLCDYYRKNNPDFYKLFCSNGSAATKPAGATSTFSDSFNVTSASLPTEPSSYGLETITSYIRKSPGRWGPTFSLIKGFHKFGTGVSTSGNNTFYGNDIVQRLQGPALVDTFHPHEPALGYVTNLNIGTSIALVEPKKGGSGSIKLGLSVRYNKTTNTWGGGPGLVFGTGPINFGFGTTKEKVSNYLPSTYFATAMVSVRLSILELEYTCLRNLRTYGLEPIHIVTSTLSLKKLTLTAAVRHLDYAQVGTVIQPHFGIQYLFSKNFSAGLLYNYIPGANSFGAQFFL
jgi:hypothetical protein